MPEFHIDLGSSEGVKTFQALDEFTRGYIECAFFTECHADNPDLEDATFADLAPSTLEKMKEDCTDFKLAADAWLFKAYTRDDMSYSSEQAGHDFWLTRNGHGAGFWDRGLGVIGDKLSELSRPYGECALYRGDDGLIYI